MTQHHNYDRREQEKNRADSGAPAAKKKKSPLSEEGAIKKKIQELEQKVVQYQNEAQEYLAGWQRAQADYQNLKKEGERERNHVCALVKKQLLLDILPMVEHVHTAISHIPDQQRNESWAKGLFQVKSQFDSWLRGMGVEIISAEGTQFDVSFHEAVGREKHKKVRSGYVVKQLRPGYLLDGKVILPAKVIVAE